MPSTYLAAVPVRAPAPWPGVRFAQRPIDRLLHSLTPSEVAVLEVLRAGPAVVETPWEELPDVIARLAASGTVRLDVLDETAATEPHRQAPRTLVQNPGAPGTDPVIVTLAPRDSPDSLATATLPVASASGILMAHVERDFQT